MQPTVVALHLGTAKRAPLRAVERVEALLGLGLEGDRHARAGSGRQVLAIEVETLEAFGLRAGDVREQVTLRGVDLSRVPEGARLRMGGAVFEMGGPCRPCARMDELRPGLRAALEGRRGRFLRVVAAGQVAVGDPLAVEA